MPTKAKPAALAPAEWIDLIARNAVRLRDAGVVRLSLEGVELELSPAAVKEEEEERGGVEDIDAGDPLQDPATYGRRDGRLPGFERLLRERGRVHE